MLRFEHSSLVRAPLPAVFAFHEDPRALERLTPPDPPVEVVRRSGGIRPGGVTVLRIGRKPLRLTWIARHTDFEQDRFVTDVQDRGPFAFWRHRHHFAAENGATRMTDSIDFSLPLGFLADPLFGWLAKRQLRKMFEYRHAQVKRFLESGHS
ncbi:MAG: SRPBCC family protein [Bryobacteraceae bacterium]|nr:SRPBCC family protein [Bryobacteraceae bacterium]